MAEIIYKGVLYNKVAELEELARNRVLDTSTNNPCYMRYVSQMNERTALKHLIADMETTTEAEIRASVVDKFAEKMGRLCENSAMALDRYDGRPLYNKDGKWHDLINDVAEQLKEE